MSNNLTPGRQAPPLLSATYLFTEADVADSQTDVQLAIINTTAAGANATNGYVAPWPGNVVAISYQLSAASGAGSLTIGPTIDGTEDADLTVSVGTTVLTGYSTVLRGKIPFDAGAVIGAEITTDSWGGTTSDLAVAVHVVFDPAGTI